MKKPLLVTVILLFSIKLIYCQPGASQGWTKAESEFEAKEYLIKTILNINTDKIIDFRIDAITASSSGELSTVVYECSELNKRGVILVFWNNEINQFNTHYHGYGFKKLDVDSAKMLFSKMESLFEHSESKGFQNGVFKLNDMIVNYYFEYGNSEYISNGFRIFYAGFDAEWGVSNFDRTKKGSKNFFKFQNDNQLDQEGFILLLKRFFFSICVVMKFNEKYPQLKEKEFLSKIFTDTVFSTMSLENQEVRKPKIEEIVLDLLKEQELKGSQVFANKVFKFS
jgi:hypothetical protein